MEPGTLPDPARRARCRTTARPFHVEHAGRSATRSDPGTHPFHVEHAGRGAAARRPLCAPFHVEPIRCGFTTRSDVPGPPRHRWTLASIHIAATSCWQPTGPMRMDHLRPRTILQLRSILRRQPTRCATRSTWNTYGATSRLVRARAPHRAHEPSAAQRTGRTALASHQWVRLGWHSSARRRTGHDTSGSRSTPRTSSSVFDVPATARGDPVPLQMHPRRPPRRHSHHQVVPSASAPLSPPKLHPQHLALPSGCTPASSNASLTAPVDLARRPKHPPRCSPHLVMPIGVAHARPSPDHSGPTVRTRERRPAPFHVEHDGAHRATNGTPAWGETTRPRCHLRRHQLPCRPERRHADAPRRGWHR